MESSFDELGSFYNGLSGKSKDDFGQGSDRFITYMNVYKNTIAAPDGCELVLVEDGEHQNRVEYGDILFTQSSETLEEVGLSSVWLHKASPFLNSFCFGFHFAGKEMINPRFIAYSLRTSYMREKIIREGQGATRYNLSSNRLKPIKLVYPSYQEQSRIASLMSRLETRIEKQQELICTLKKYKRGLSDTLFAQIAHNPDCVIVKFGEAFELLQNNTFSREELTDIPSSVQNIHYGDVLIKYGSVVNIATDMPPYIKPSNDLQRFSRSSYLCDGDIVFADTAEDYSVGKATEIVGVNGASVLSGLHTIPCRPFMKFQPMYLGFYFNSSLFRAQIYPLVQGTKVSSISKGELAKVSVHIPNEGDQRRIASMLYSLDLRVAHEERQVKALTDVKAAFLQQLFI